MPTAIATNAPGVGTKPDSVAVGATYWAVNATTTDTAGDEVLKAAPGSGLSLYVTSILINCVVTATIEIADAGSVLLGPFKFVAGGNTFMHLPLARPIKLGANQALHVNHGGIACAVYVEGYTAA